MSGWVSLNSLISAFMRTPSPPLKKSHQVMSVCANAATEGSNAMAAETASFIIFLTFVPPLKHGLRSPRGTGRLSPRTSSKGARSDVLHFFRSPDPIRIPFQSTEPSAFGVESQHFRHSQREADLLLRLRPAFAALDRHFRICCGQHVKISGATELLGELGSCRQRQAAI